MRKIIAVLSVIFLGVAVAGCGSGTAMRSSWSHRNLVSNSQPTSWMIVAETVRGHATRRIEMSAEQMAGLHVRSSSDSGEVWLVVSDDDPNFRMSVDLSGEFDEYVDLGDAFEPGRIRLRLEFVDVEGLELYLRW